MQFSVHLCVCVCVCVCVLIYFVISLIMFMMLCQITADTVGFIGHAGEDGEPVSFGKTEPEQHYHY